MSEDGAGPPAAVAAPAAASAAAAPAGEALEFGWVPAEVVRALLEEVGNFRARAAAIELLHSAVLDVRHDVGAVLPTLSSFLAFLLRLVGDPNFKIAMSAMTILEDLVAALGPDVQPYLGTLVAPLTERMGDNVQMVRQASGRALAALARALGPTPVLAALGGALVHPSWRVREEGVNAHTAALLSHPKERFDYPACVRTLAGAAADEAPRVAVAALEAFALLHARLGALLQGLLTAVGASEAVKRAVAERVQKAPQLGLPTLDSQGNVQHQAHARPPSAQHAKPAPAAVVSTRPAQQQQQQQQSAHKAAPVEVQLAASPAKQQLQGNSWAAGSSAASAPAPLAATWPEPGSPSAAQYFPAQTWSPSAGPAAVRGEEGWQATAAAAADAAVVGGGVEYSAPSCASSVASYSSYASFSMGAAGLDAAHVPAGQEVERSGGSLLSWRRPERRANQASFTGPAGGRPAAAAGVPGSPGGASLAVMGRAESLERHQAVQSSQQQPQQQAGRSSMRGFLRSAKSAVQGSATSHAVAAPPPPAVVRRTLPVQPQPQPQAMPVMPITHAVAPAGGTSAGAYNADLYSSVANWQRQRQGSTPTGEAGSTSGDGSAAADNTWSSLGLQAQGQVAQDSSLAVEPRSDSLLQWRRQPRKGTAAPQQPPQLQVAAAKAAEPGSPQPPSPASPARLGSASLKRALTGFTKKLFGGEAEPGADCQAPLGAMPGEAEALQNGGGSNSWSIAAVRQEQQEQQAQQAPGVPIALGTGWPARPSVSMAVPAAEGAVCQPAAAAQQHGEQAADSGAATGAERRLSRLKQLSERRRVSSAPINRPQQEEPGADGGEGESQQQQQQQQGSVPPVLAAPGSPGPPLGSTAGAATSAEAAGAEGGSPASRPGLQALKARARTARVLSNGSVFVPPQTGGGSIFQAYSMEAVNDVFGPDQPVLGSLASTSSWSPIKTASAFGAGSGAGSSASTPTRPSLLLRTASSGLSASDGASSGTPTAVRSPSGRLSWRGSSAALPDSPSAAAGSPKGLASAGAADSGFSPASEASPLAQPEAALQQAMAALQAAALSQKKELDWQAQYDALRVVRRLALHHPGVLAPPAVLHGLVGLAAPVVDALRSTMARLAISVFQGLAEALGPALGAELDAFVPLLVKRAGQVSLSGRDNFLAVEADRALAAVVALAGDARVATALLNSLASKVPDVRAKAAMHLDACLQQHGSRLVAQLGATGGGGAGMTARLLRAAVALLDEGGLEARSAGKRIVWELRRLVDGAAAAGGGDDFKRALGRLDCKTDKVWEVLELGRMPAPPARLPSAGYRPPSGSAPASPNATAGYSPTKAGILSAGGSTLGLASRGSLAGAAAAGSGAAASNGGGGGSGAAGAPAALASALPPSKWQPGARPGAVPSASGGSGKGSGKGSTRGSVGSVTDAAAAPVRRGSRPCSAGVPGPAPSGSLAGLDPELQQRLEAAGSQMGSPEWKARLEGLEVLAAALGGGQAGGMPVEALLWLADALKDRATDANLKVQQQALAVLNSMLGSAGAGMAPAGPALLPSLCKCLDSGNPSVRQAAAQALDAVLASWPPEAHLALLMSALGSPAGAARGKEALLSRLPSLVAPLWRTRPALVRQHVLPAVFSLLAAGRRPELRQLAQAALAGLAPTLGPELRAAAHASPLLAPAQMQLVEEALGAAR